MMHVLNFEEDQSLIRCAEEGSLAADQYKEAVEKVDGLQDVSGHDNQAPFLGQTGAELHDRAFEFGVKAGCRLVEEEGFGAKEQFLGDGDTFSLSTR